MTPEQKEAFEIGKRSVEISNSSLELSDAFRFGKSIATYFAEKRKVIEEYGKSEWETDSMDAFSVWGDVYEIPIGREQAYNYYKAAKKLFMGWVPVSERKCKNCNYFHSHRQDGKPNCDAGICVSLDGTCQYWTPCYDEEALKTVMKNEKN